MAYTTINKSSLHFNTKLYTGNGTAIGSGGQAITGVGFQPDWTWIKLRNGAAQHVLFDVVRGVTKRIYSSLDNAESANAESLTAFGTDGFTLGNNAGVNENGDTYVSWNWKAGNAQGSSNTDGSINTTYTSVNTTAGFSISTYTGTGSTATFGHGLGAVPKMILIKRTNDTEHWQVYHQSLGNTKVIELSSNGAAFTDANRWNNTTPTNSLVYLGNHASVNASGSTYVAYCFAEKKGFSKFGSYVGNGNADGTFVYTGFKPAFVMTKRTDTTSAWDMFDNKREGYNPDNDALFANLTNAEDATDRMDLVSNGFKMRISGGSPNYSSGSYIYMAFGQTLVGSNNIPSTAR